MGLWANIKRKASPVPAFGQTGEIKFRTLSFGTVDSLKAYLDSVFFIDKDVEITVTYEDAEQVLNYIPTYFDGKKVNFVEKYEDNFVAILKNNQNQNSNVAYGSFLPVRTTGYLTNIPKVPDMNRLKE